MRLFLITLFFLLGCSKSDDPANGNGQQPPPETTYQTVNAFPNLSFGQPLDLQHPSDGSQRLFIVEQSGVIRVFENDASATTSTVFLDIQNQVDDSGSEEGLLGLAFHPDYESNGYFYVNYTAANPDRTVISRFQASNQNPDAADVSSELEILTYAQPFSNHNGGQLVFGPDGYLYIAVGDGGSGGDPQGNGQNRATLLGSILRIDVDNPQNGQSYGIPSDNPYVGNTQGFREEIYAYGLRNPWRFSFDAENDQLWTGDVGQNSYEEIDIIESGNNYGWNIMEGAHCYDSNNCDQSGLTLPVWEYGREQGISVTGGFVYRGPTLTNLNGRYIYGDFGSGKIWALDNSDSNNPQNTELLEADFPISSFGVDAENELYICGFDGSIYRLEEVQE